MREGEAISPSWDEERRRKRERGKREKMMGMLQLSGSYGRVDDLLSFCQTVFPISVSGGYALIRSVG